MDTKGASDVYVLQNTIAPGGTFGWHSHPGPSLVIVKSGTATFYHGDPGCPKVVVRAGTGFVDNGHDLHVVRNEGTVDLVTVVVSLVPAGFARRIDEPSPATAPFEGCVHAAASLVPRTVEPGSPRVPQRQLAVIEPKRPSASSFGPAAK